VSDRRGHAESDFPDFDDEAIDLALVHEDDEYLDRLSGTDLGESDSLFGGFGDDQLTELLMSWRRDVDAEPIEDLVDTKLATVTVHTATTQRKRKPRLLVPVAAAAAVLAIAFAGFGLAARDAQPGDTLWALTKVLYADHARSVEAAQAVKDDLREAKAALADGDIDVAKSKLQDAHAALPTVLPDDGHNDLQAEHTSLMAQLPGNTSDQAGSPPQPTPSTQPNADSSSGSTDNNGSATDPSPTDPPETQPPTDPTSGNDTTAPTAPPSTSQTSRDGPGTSDTSGTSGEPAGENEEAPAAENP
jgi:hypothetical protein